MLGRNGQRKPGTTRGSPRRSRTAKALRISCHAVKSRCARGWGGWGRLSDDGSRQHNSGQSEDPWGGGRPILHGGAPSSARPDTARDYRRATRCAKGGRKPNINKWMPGAGLSWLMCGKAPPYMPAFQPYRGKPAVRNDREGRGNDGIIRSPGSRLELYPTAGGREVTRVPTATGASSSRFWAAAIAWSLAARAQQPTMPVSSKLRRDGLQTSSSLITLDFSRLVQERSLSQ